MWISYLSKWTTFCDTLASPSTWDHSEFYQVQTLQGFVVHTCSSTLAVKKRSAEYENLTCQNEPLFVTHWHHPQLEITQSFTKFRSYSVLSCKLEANTLAVKKRSAEYENLIRQNEPLFVKHWHHPQLEITQSLSSYQVQILTGSCHAYFSSTLAVKRKV